MRRNERKRKIKVIGIDLDGVMNYYPDPFVDFLNIEKGLPVNDLIQAKSKIAYLQYRKLKEEYRTSGYKATLEPREGVKEFLLKLRDMGFYILIVTKRPAWKYEEVLADTIDWFRSNKLHYDVIIFGGDRKHLKILQEFPYILYLVEDHRDVSIEVVKHSSIKVFLLDNKYNQGDLVEGVTRVHDFNDVIWFIKKHEEVK